MLIRLRGAGRGERGQTSAEYIGMVAFIAAVVAALILAAPGIGGLIADKIGSVVSAVGGEAGSQGGPAAPGSGGPGAPGVPGSGGPGAPGVPGTGGPGYNPLNLPGDIVGNPLWKLATSAFGLGTAPGKIRESLQAIPAWQLYNRIVAPIAEKYGPNAPITLRTYMRWQQLTSNSSNIAGNLRSVGVRVPPTTAAGRILGTIGKVLAPVGMVTSALSLFSPPAHDGWRGVGDRFAAGAGLFAGIVGTAALVGVGIASAPVVAIAAAVAGVGAAAWTIGNLVVDHWDDITGAASAAGGWIADQASNAADFVGDAAETTADFAGDAADAVGDAAGAVGDAISFWD